MTNDQEFLKHISDEAKRLFLGNGPVVGIGVTKENDTAIVFLLKTHSEEHQNLISEWANEIGVPVRFQITGFNFFSKVKV